jgi:putative oxidoreductase
MPGREVRHGIDFVRRVYTRLDSLEWVARLAVRIAIGLEFFGSGLGKLGRVSGLIQFFRSLGIPGAEILAPLVASTELVCGVLIAVGLATRTAAVMLCGVMTVAIVTAAAPEKHITASWHGLLEFFYLPEVLFFLLLAWIVFAGPGRASLDARLCPT